jgi:hypothetical protein
MKTGTALVEDLAARGGLERLPQADAAIQQMETARATLQGQRDRLRPEILSREETEIERVTVEAIHAAYRQAEDERTRSLQHERGTIIADAKGTNVSAERSAAEARWIGEVPALLAAVPFLDDVEELRDLVDLAFVRESPTLIRTIAPAVMQRLTALKADAVLGDVRSRYTAWRRANPTHQRRLAEIEGKEALIRQRLQESRDMLLQAHGLKRQYY